MTKRKTNEQFVEELHACNQHLIPLTPYTSSHEKVRVRCSKCAHEWSAYPTNLIQHHSGCPKCAGNLKKTNQRFVSELKKMHGDKITALEPYVNNSTGILVHCNICGNEWHPRPTDLLRGKGCRVCADRQKGIALRKTHDGFVAELKQVNPNIYVLSEYRTDKDALRVRCGICGNEWQATPNNLLRGKGCSICAHKSVGLTRRKTHKQFLSELQEINPDIRVLGQYVRDREPVEVECLQCGNKWSPVASNLLQGRGCPRCAHSQSSFVENYLYFSFVSALGENKVFSRIRTVIDGELDVYIPDLKLALEPGGYFFHKDSIDKDIEKQTRCAQAGITLIIIYDNCKGEIEKPLNDNMVVYQHDLGSERNHKTLKALVESLFIDFGIRDSLGKVNWKTVTRKAHLFSQRRSDDGLKAEMVAKGIDSIELVGHYSGSHTPIEFRCKECGRIWKASPHNVLQGKGCRSCAFKHLGESKRRAVRCIETGDIFESVSLANKTFHTSHVSDCCNGHRPLAGGYHWEFA